MLLRELTAPTRRLAFAGLAKNTGKTVALATLLGELAARGETVGVTSIGRDGEAHDAIDARIDKPRIHLRAGSLVATTDMLLSASAVPHERLEATGLRTPLGRIQIARLHADGAVEVAGPTTARDVRVVSETMLALGAERVLVDGALDRRAAASPAIADGVVVSTGAALHRDVHEVMRRTREAVELLRLPVSEDPAVRELVPALPSSALITARGDAILIEDRIVLDGTDAEVANVLRAAPDARHLVVAGALCEPFAEQVVRALARQPAREVSLVVADGTRVFLSHRSCGWYRRQGVAIEALAPIDLRAITVNPVLPHSHRFDGALLRQLVQDAIPEVPVLDVMDPAYVRPATSGRLRGGPSDSAAVPPTAAGTRAPTAR